MRFIIFAFFLLGIACNAHAQFLSQDAKGKGSIPLPLNGAGLSVDIGKSEIALGVNNYQKALSDLSSKWRSFVGLNLSGKNATGLAKLFDAGEIVPEGNLQGFVGWSKNNFKTIVDAIKAKFDTNKEWQEINQKIKELNDVTYVNAARKIIKRVVDSIPDSTERGTMRDMIDKRLQNEQPAEWPEVLLTIDPCKTCLNLSRCCALKLVLKKLSTEVADLRESLDKPLTELQNRQLQLHGQIERQTTTPRYYCQFTGFLMGGIQGRSFKRYIGLATPDLTKSFQDTNFRAGNIGLGLNLQYRAIWFGITFNHMGTDNFSELSPKEYTLRRTDTAGQVLIQEKKFTAYSGKYARLHANELNADLLYSFRLNPEDTARLLVNPYVHALLGSSNKDYLLNYTNIGLGLYFLGSGRKFIGGLYIELPDVNNNREKAKPADESSIRPPLQKLTFGITTKINLSSIFSFADRPRKPDSEN